jgi:hypothetical protein
VKAQRIVLLDVGDRPRFERSRLAARWAIQCLATPETRLRPNLGDLREATSRDPWDIARYVTYPTRLMHVMAHGERTGFLTSDHRFPYWPWQRRFRLDALESSCEQAGRLPQIECLLLDACESNTPDWRAGLRRLVPRGDSMVLIGTTESVTWPEAVTYTTGFYSALLSDAWSPDRDEFQGQVLDAHHRAANAYKSLHGSATLFKASVINGRA